jgi:DNA-binding CsgD family transcriptional regulator
MRSRRTRQVELFLERLSNAEIGARLNVSQHAVAYHLGTALSKLGITLRSQLSRTLPDAAAKVTGVTICAESSRRSPSALRSSPR